MHKYKTHVTNKSSTTRRQPPEEVLGSLLKEIFAATPGAITIAIGGPGGTGKSTFARKLAKRLADSALLRLDDYKTPRATRKGRNLFGAHPDANQMALAADHIALIKQNSPFDKPVYNAVTGQADTTEKFAPARFNILDGEISTYRDFYENVDFAIFIDSDYKTQLATRTSRDIAVRGYTWEKAIATFLQSNLREFTLFGAESKNWADVHLYCKEDYTLFIESVAGELFTQFETLLNKSLAAIDLTGLIVPVTTPFDIADKIDKRMFIEHLELLAAQGVKRLLINGTTAEFFSMTGEEQKVCLKLAREYFPGILIYHTGHSSLKRTKRQAAWAQDYGADAIVAMLPYGIANVPKQGIIDYFNSLAETIAVPFILSNFPKHTGNALDAEMLSKIKHFGIQDSSENLNLLSATPNYYNNEDENILAAYQKGAVGFVSARANSFAPIMVQMEEALKRNDSTAKTLQQKITHLKEQTAGPNEIAQIKHALSKQLKNYPTRVRLPLTEQ